MADKNPLVKDSTSVNEVDVDLVEKVANLTINKEQNVPSPFTTFEATCFPQDYIKKLYEAGFKKPTQIQAQSWPLAMQGKDIVAVAGKGSGKKLGFLIPCFIGLKRLQNDPKRGPTLLVLCPSNDFATQIQNEAMKFGSLSGIKSVCLTGAAANMLKHEAKVDMVVATPAELIDILECGSLSLQQVAYLVLYEANNLLKPSIEPQVNKILSHLPVKHCQTLVFTTTWPGEAKDIATGLLLDPVLVSVGDDISDPVPEISTNIEGLYSSTGIVPRELKPTAEKKLLVFTVNGILADMVRLDRYSSYSYQADFEFSGNSVFIRPFCADFMKFCFANFEVGIWSSRIKRNLEKIVNNVLGDSKNKLLFHWDQSNCTTTNLCTKNNQNKPVFFKELKKLWGKEEPGLPWQKGRFTEANTLLIDDSPYKALCNPPCTAIFPHPYNFRNKADKSLGIGGDLRLYLEKLAKADDVRCFVKDNPFGQPAMTESHPDWKYYLPALRTLRNLDF